MPTPDEDGGEDTKTVDDSGFVGLIGHAYRGEVSRATAWRERLDRATNWAVILTATLLTWAFSSGSRPHYVLLVGVVMVTVFLDRSTPVPYLRHMEIAGQAVGGKRLRRSTPPPEERKTPTGESY